MNLEKKNCQSRLKNDLNLLQQRLHEFLNFNALPLNNNLHKWHFNVWMTKGTYRDCCVHGNIHFPLKYPSPEYPPVFTVMHHIYHPNICINNDNKYGINIYTINIKLLSSFNSNTNILDIFRELINIFNCDISLYNYNNKKEIFSSKQQLQSFICSDDKHSNINNWPKKLQKIKIQTETENKIKTKFYLIFKNLSHKTKEIHIVKYLKININILIKNVLFQSAHSHSHSAAVYFHTFNDMQKTLKYVNKSNANLLNGKKITIHIININNINNNMPPGLTKPKKIKQTNHLKKIKIPKVNKKFNVNKSNYNYNDINIQSKHQTIQTISHSSYSSHSSHSSHSSRSSQSHSPHLSHSSHSSHSSQSSPLLIEIKKQLTIILNNNNNNNNNNAVSIQRILNKINNENMLSCTIHTLIHQSLLNPSKANKYAQIASMLMENLPNITNFEFNNNNNDNDNNSDNSIRLKMLFRQLIIRKCSKLFDLIRKQLIDDKFIAFMITSAHLYNNKLISDNVIFYNLLFPLLNNDGMKSIEIDGICKLFEISGKYLNKNNKKYNDIQKIIKSLINISNINHFDKRIVSKIKQINSWIINDNNDNNQSVDTLTIEILQNIPIAQQQQLIGNKLYPKIYSIVNDTKQTGKITQMFINQINTQKQEILDLLTDPFRLIDAINVAKTKLNISFAGKDVQNTPGGITKNDTGRTHTDTRTTDRINNDKPINKPKKRKRKRNKNNKNKNNNKNNNNNKKNNDNTKDNNVYKAKAIKHFNELPDWIRLGCQANKDKNDEIKVNDNKNDDLFINEFNNLQFEVISDLCIGKKCIIISSAGSGKSATAVLASLYRLYTKKSPNNIVLIAIDNLHIKILYKMFKKFSAFVPDYNLNIYKYINAQQLQLDADIFTNQNNRNIFLCTSGAAIDLLRKGGTIFRKNVLSLYIMDCDSVPLLNRIKLLIPNLSSHTQICLFGNSWCESVKECISQIILKLNKSSLYFLTKYNKMNHLLIKCQNKNDKNNKLIQIIRMKSFRFNYKLRGIIYANNKSECHEIALFLRNRNILAHEFLKYDNLNEANIILSRFNNCCYDYLIVNDHSSIYLLNECDNNAIKIIINYSLKSSYNYLKRSCCTTYNPYKVINIISLKDHKEEGTYNRIQDDCGIFLPETDIKQVKRRITQ